MNLTDRISGQKHDGAGDADAHGDDRHRRR